ncbi:alanine racemase [Homoserinibacter sp. YIM 151385]|uniref:alanine racemase n=1 Tax=Homoserinibacter sp. YIM 151385 TaxID=2985506 RepID=UPI0022F092CE|nr:alanine racemase [Homoserinibacter sp. YIM 151385]WBU37713.1 alanine racemase [Homoserinibacter sp. YIM 151385]
MTRAADGRRTREARIDLDALGRNVVRLREAVAPAKVMVVVKAQAYGHGALPAALAAEAAGADWLGTADLEEALALRRGGVRAPLLAWLHGTGADFRAGAAAGIDLGLSSLLQLERAADAGDAGGADGPVRVHLKLDTGLGRNGIPPRDVEAVFRRAAELEHAGRVRVVGLFSHLSNTDREEDLGQLAAFERLVELARGEGVEPELRHLAASAGALALPETRLDLVRLGIASYGLSPDPRVDVAPLGLEPVMELSAEVVAVRRVPAGHGVSYGLTWRAPRETGLALLPLGYGDGIPRAASDRGIVVIRGERFTIAGRVAMDQLVVDIGDAPVEVGDRAVLWGDPAAGAPSVEAWADAVGTIDYELVTRVGGRVERVHVGGPEGAAEAEA